MFQAAEWGIKRALHSIDPERMQALQKLRAQVFTKGARVKSVQKTDNILNFVYSKRVRKPDVLFCGESNAGKSSLLSSVVQTGAFGQRSNYGQNTVGGSTKKINRVDLAGLCTISDSPGYGRVDKRSSYKPQLALTTLTALTQQYIAALASTLLHRVYILSPSTNEGLTEWDLRMGSLCEENGVPYTVVLTKTDLVSMSQLYRTVETLKEQAPGVELIPFSTKDPQSMVDMRMDILHNVTRWLDPADISLPTLQGMEYSVPNMPVEELEAIMEKYRRPLTQEEERAITMRALGQEMPHRDRMQLAGLRKQFSREDSLFKEALQHVRDQQEATDPVKASQFQFSRDSDAKSRAKRNTPDHLPNAFVEEYTPFLSSRQREYGIRTGQRKANKETEVKKKGSSDQDLTQGMFRHSTRQEVPRRPAHKRLRRG
eukprot:TRINITY_DN44833_c0_g1_i1.p1 TRINITY_DN44833_c0_g1~~TRINITY_DN44833_c0_g1_i1.p1  ORF type:complete len:429 (+),score=97.42 TRINITY_DN44833_c0_g1_i1:36-1322(+)